MINLKCVAYPHSFVFIYNRLISCVSLYCYFPVHRSSKSSVSSTNLWHDNWARPRRFNQKKFAWSHGESRWVRQWSARHRWRAVFRLIPCTLFSKSWHEKCKIIVCIIQKNKFQTKHSNLDAIWMQPMCTHNLTQAQDLGSYTWQWSYNCDYHLLTNRWHQESMVHLRG